MISVEDGGKSMAIGSSGRVVLEISPELKQQLHDAVKRDGKTLKEWFVEQARSYLDRTDPQARLFDEDEGKRAAP